MYVSILAARPLRLRRSTLKSGGGSAGWRDEEDAGPAAQVISVIEDFAQSIDWESFSAAFGEPLVEAVAAAFDGDDARILKELGGIIESFKQGLTAREIVGDFLLETPGDGATMSRASAVSRRSSGRAAVIAAAKRSYGAELADPRRLVICSERAWVHTCLRDADEKPLTAGEVARYGIAEEPPGRGGRGASRAWHQSQAARPVQASARERTIVAAKKTYAAEQSAGNISVACAADRWINAALRGAGQQPLTDAEVARHSVGAGGVRDRAALIAAAKKTYAEEAADPDKMMICSEQAWVHTALRDADQAPLTDEEIARCGVTEESPRRAGTSRSVASRDRATGTPPPNQDRATLVSTALLAYAREIADSRNMKITTARAWVNLALRDAGQKPLTDAEMALFSVSTVLPSSVTHLPASLSHTAMVRSASLAPKGISSGSL